MAEGKTQDFEIKDEQKLLQLALDLGVKIGDRTNNEIAAGYRRNTAEDEFGKQEGELLFIKTRSS